MKDRIYYLDAMRAILMMLGVVLHSAQVFSPEQTWKIYSNDTTAIAAWLVNTIHMFRMPAFFIISGYFAMFTLKKYKIKKFLKVRIFRIILPLVTTALVVNSLQTYILVKSGWMMFDLDKYIKTGEWISDLWFLINLIIYFMVFSVGYLILKPFYSRIARSVYKIYQKTNIHTLLFSFIGVHLLLIIAISFLSKYININYSILNINSILSYFPFFIIGLFLYGSKDMLHSFIKISPIINISMILLSIFFTHLSSGYDGKLFKFIYFFFDLTSKYYLSAFCFYLFYELANRKSKIFYFLSNASYSVYLFHQVLVVSIGLLLLKINIGGILGLSILIVSVALISLAIHKYLILKISILSFLFNGKR